MNNENKIDLSIEMYEDLKETLVKAIKNAKAGGVGNAGWENTQLERIERLIEAAERSQGQIAQHARTTATAYGLAGSKNRAGAGIYRQIQHTAGAVGRETGGDRQGEQADTYIDRAGRASRRSIDKARRPARTGTPPYLYARHQFFENISDDVRHAWMYFPASCIHLPNLGE